jgi:hypothetical protein
VSDFLDLNKLADELGAENKAQSEKAEARSAERIARQIAAGIRDSEGQWKGQVYEDEDED